MPDPAGPKPHEHPLKTSAVPEAVTPLSDGTHPPGARQLALFPYAELAVTTNFTFLTGASHPDEFVTQAAALGYHALAITDTNTLAGVVRAHVAAQAANLPLVCGVRLRFVDAAWLSLFVYPTDRASYGRLCRLLTLGKRRAPKGECRLYFADVFEHSAGLLAIAQLHGDLDVADLPQPFSRQAAGLRVGPNGVPEPGVSVQPRIASDDAVAQTRSPAGLRRNAVLEDVPRSDTRPRTTDALQQLRDAFDDDRLSLAIQRTYAAEDRRQLEQRVALARALDLPLVAINDAHYHLPERRALHDVLTCIRCGCTLEQAGFRLAPNAERHLKPSAEMARLFAEYPAALERSVVIARRAAAFSLDLLRYEYPDEVVPPGRTPMGHLRELTWEGAQQRYPQGIPDKITTQLEHEFALIDELRYAPYFLTVHDLVRHARSLGILCQGRGAAANSAVCYCLGVTAVNPDQIDILFERFVSRERREPPDIDIDFEHERREEVIQYIYQKYGRERAGLTAEVISYRGRSAVRDVGRALGLAPDLLRRLASQVNYWEETAFEEAAGGNEAPLQALGFDVHQDMIRTLARLARELMGFPRHLSQHVGGFVMTRGPLCELTPIENASMENRTTIEWDKDDIEALGILKVDVLGLGMLSCIRKAFQFIEATERRSDEATEGEEQRRQSDGGKTENPGSLFEHYDLGGSNEGKVVFSTSSLRRSVTPSLPSPTSSLRRSVTPSLPTATKETRNGHGTDVSGSDCLAKEHGTGPVDIPHDRADAGRGAFRTDQSDAAGGGVGSFEHRRGLRTPEPPGLHQTPTNRQGIADGTRNAVRTRDLNENDSDGSGLQRTTEGSRSGIAGAVSRPGAEGGRVSDGATERRSDGGKTKNPGDRFGCGDFGGSGEGKAVFSTSSLRRSVASSLPSPTSSLRRSVAPSLSLHSISPTDPLVFDMICRADTLGVFQIESRAQMTMLPRLKPRTFYDLVIEVAIVRPGPIVGDMVHPYLRRRNKEEEFTYPDEKVEKVLKKTLGIPLFQEQAMALAITAAGFTAGEAEMLRRTISAWKTRGKDAIPRYRRRFIAGMLANGYELSFAEQCFERLKGFSEYGFPESHAASFALLVYASAWLKCYHPAAFAAALINSQPMGFYAPAQIIRDASDHGVEVRPVDVNWSAWDCTLEGSDEATERRSDGGKEKREPGRGNREQETPRAQGSMGLWPVVGNQRRSDEVAAGVSPAEEEVREQGTGLRATKAGARREPGIQCGTNEPAMRLGFRMVKGLKESDARAIVATVRQHGPFDSVFRLWRSSGVSAATLLTLARADAFGSFGLDRQHAVWAVQALDGRPLPLFEQPFQECQDASASGLPAPAPSSEVVRDYRTVGLSLKAHPLSFLRPRLDRLHVCTAAEARDEARTPSGRWVRVAGLVLFRQRPATAKGVMFMTLEDETGRSDLILRPWVQERFRAPALTARLVIARGKVERNSGVVHVLVSSLEDGGRLTEELPDQSRNFR